ncbi:ORF111 [Saltwater crocodilepox virus]|nr:ORF111 [Saltwater crocodilepox virus]
MAFLPRARLVRLRMQWSMAFAMASSKRRRAPPWQTNLSPNTET